MRRPMVGRERELLWPPQPIVHGRKRKKRKKRKKNYPINQWGIHNLPLQKNIGAWPVATDQIMAILCSDARTPTFIPTIAITTTTTTINTTEKKPDGELLLSNPLVYCNTVVVISYRESIYFYIPGIQQYTAGGKKDPLSL